MLPKNHRLRKSKDIQAVFRYGRSQSNVFFRILALKTNHSATRIAFVVSNQVSKKASVRNLVKRRMREIIRVLLPSLVPGYDVVIQARNPVAHIEFIELKKGLENTLRRLQILRP